LILAKKITAPYSQANELVFGQSSGQQCVAMSLCSLIYNNKQGINSADDLVSIINIGNQLYSSLSQLTRQSFLMQTELPTLLNVFETDYELLYSETYTGTIHIQFHITICHPTKKQDRMKRQITANMNISLGDNDNIYQYSCTFVLRGLHSVTAKMCIKI